MVEKERLAGSAFGALLRRHRLAAGLSQEDLAEQARMSARGIGALERGDRRYPYRETIVLLSKALGLTSAAASEFEAAATRPRQLRPSVSGSVSAGEFGPVATPANNLPPQLTSFIGRETEIAEITALLGDHRLVTLTGSGGVGKTRTSLRVGEGFFGAFADGVWLIELAPLSRGEYLPGTVAQVLGLRLADDGDPVANLARGLKSKQMLLIFDNCEHLVVDVAKVVSAILSDCTTIKILTSSRSPLRVIGEATYRVPSLLFPPAAVSAPLCVDAALLYVAVALFVDRARAIDNRFTLTDDNAPVVADICRRLDGIALAIELAAARVNVLSPRELLDRLSERFRFLTDGGRDRLPRHQTLRALIDWSHDLLDKRERTLFRRLGIFVNGFTLEGAVAVGSGGDLDELEVFDVLVSLADKSLVLVDFGGERTRYRLLESTREYALETLVASGERSWFARRHAEWVAAFVEGADEEYWTLPEAHWLASLEGELDNLRAALHWALEERGDAVVGGRIASAVYYLWFDAGLIREGCRWINQALAALDETTHPRVVGQLLLAQAGLVDGEARVFAVQRAIRSLVLLCDPLRLARAYVTLAWGHAEMHSVDASLDASGRALTLLRSLELRQPALEAAALEMRGFALQGLDRCSEARTAYDEALGIYHDMGDERRCVRIEINLAELEFVAGQVGAALALGRTAASRAREVGAFHREAMVRANAAAYHLVLREIDEAKREARVALALARSTQADVQSIFAIQHLAAVAVLEGDAERAARLRGYVNARLGALGFGRGGCELRTYDMLMTELHARSSDERIAQLGEAGARLSDDAAAAEAFGARAAHDALKADDATSCLIGSSSTKLKHPLDPRTKIPETTERGYA